MTPSTLHAIKGHPHDHDCEICRRARKRAAPKVASGDSTPNPKGYTMGIDYAGPIDPDVDGNKYWMQGVDTSHTGLGFVRLQRDKSGSSGLKSLLSMDREMQTTHTDPIPMIRVHSDEDKSFIEGDMAAHLLENTAL